MRLLSVGAALTEHSSLGTIISIGGVCGANGINANGDPTCGAKKPCDNSSLYKTVKHVIIYVVVTIVCPIHLNKHAPLLNPPVSPL